MYPKVKVLLKDSLFIPSLIFLIMNLSSCKSSPVQSVSKELSRRDYVWTIDTIKLPAPYFNFQTWMTSMWASDTNDIFIGGFNSYVYGQLFHYDGKSWNMVLLPKYNYAEPTINSIIGFSKNDIYFAGAASYELWWETPKRWVDSSIIYHYDGHNFTYSLVNHGGALRSITGTPNDMYAGGEDNTLFRFNGVEWKKEEVEFPIQGENNGNLVLSVLKRRNGDVLLSCGTNTLGRVPIGYYELIKTNDKWSRLDSIILDPSDPNFKWKWGLNMWESPEGNLYSDFGGGNVYKFNGKGWDKMTSGKLWDLFCIGGSSDNNIFAANKEVIHYNGNDWQEITELSNKYGFAQAIQCIKGQVFILFTDYSYSYVARGRLKN